MTMPGTKASGRRAKEAVASTKAKQQLPRVLAVESPQGEATGALRARVATMPELASASVIFQHAQQQVGEFSITDTMFMLQKHSKAVNAGDLNHAEAMLSAQAIALNTLFGALSQRFAMNMGTNMEAMEAYLKLALRAQNQCRATLETLATIKNPPVVFAKQANIAHGHQQVNNGAAVPVSRVRGMKRSQTKLLETEHGERLDTGTTTTAGGSDPAMATVEVLDRPKKRRGQGARQS